MVEQTIDVWMVAPPGVTYSTGLDLADYEGRVVQVNNRVVGYIERVLEVRPEGLKVRLMIDGDKIPWGLG